MWNFENLLICFQVGTLYFAYFPTIVITIYETIANEAAHPLALKVTLLCLMTAPFVNSFLFGFRNKSVQMIFLNYMRKELYKNEVQQVRIKHSVKTSEIFCVLRFP